MPSSSGAIREEVGATQIYLEVLHPLIEFLLWLFYGFVFEFLFVCLMYVWGK